MGFGLGGSSVLQHLAMDSSQSEDSKLKDQGENRGVDLWRSSPIGCQVTCKGFRKVDSLQREKCLEWSIESV